jgi:hypothetical protein
MFSIELARCDLCGGMASYRLAALASTALGERRGTVPQGQSHGIHEFVSQWNDFDACVDCAASTIDRGDAIETERILIHV